MRLLTIGEFARASRLSPKALRLYDRLGLLRPERVDPDSGYRYYDPGQLERARLVAWLRRLGMPLARIRTVCDLAGQQATAEIAEYWSRIEAETGERRALAAFLVDHLSRPSPPPPDPVGGALPGGDGAGKETTMPEEPTTLTVRYAVQSDHGRVRESNQDWAFAGSRLFAVADGFGADGDAEPASAVAIEALKSLDTAVPAGDVLNALEDAVARADSAVRDHVDSAPETGTTLTAMLWSGSRLALVHVGDSRVYLRRDGELFQITHDHTVVRSLVDEGRLMPEEVASHPQRSVLLRALHGGDEARPDAQLREAQPGDRYLLCSDGLYNVVPVDAVQEVLGEVSDPERTVRRLVNLANQAGGPDNITCLVADIVPSG